MAAEIAAQDRERARRRKLWASRHEAGTCRSGGALPSKRHRYCSVECRNDARNAKRRKRPETKECLWCSREFSTVSATRVWCSDRCRTAGWRWRVLYGFDVRDIG